MDIIDGSELDEIESLPEGGEDIGPDGQPISPFEQDSNGDEKSIEPDGLPIDDTQTSKFDEPGRVRRFATVMNLLNSLLGAGILSVPGSLKHAGIIPSIVLLTLIAGLSHIATVMVIKLQQRVICDGLDELALKVTGKIGSISLSFMSMFFCFGAMVGYLVIGGDMIMSWFRLANFEVSGLWPRALLILIYSCIIPAALTIPRQLKLLSYFSMATVFFIAFFFLAMIIKAVTDLPNGVGEGIILGKGGMGLFSSISIYALTFALPIVTLPIVASYNKEVKKRSIASLATVIACYVFVIIPSILGYCMKGQDIKDNVLNSYDDNDILMILCRIGFFFVVSFSYPCIGQSTIASISLLIYKKNDQKDLTRAHRGIVLFIINAIPIILACFLPTASPALSVAGALGGCVVDFFYPPLMWFLLSKKEWFHWQNLLCIVFGLFGLVTGAVCTYQAVVDAISSYSSSN